MAEVHLALGANLGERERNLIEAVQRLSSGRAVAISAVSGVWETEPVGNTDQPRFLNLALRGTTALAPEALLALTQQTESDLGRVRLERWGPRTIDIDILDYDGLRVEREGLTLPHPRMTERSFVMVPLAEISPELVVQGATAAHWAGQLGTFGLVRIGDLEWIRDDQ